MRSGTVLGMVGLARVRFSTASTAGTERAPLDRGERPLESRSPSAPTSLSGGARRRKIGI